jgi:hypothetical protein
MSIWFILAGMLAQFLYWPSAVVGVLLGLVSRSWRLLVPLALVATVLDLALIVVSSGDSEFAIMAIRKNLAFWSATMGVGALGHVAIGIALRRRLARSPR